MLSLPITELPLPITELPITELQITNLPLPSYWDRVTELTFTGELPFTRLPNYQVNNTKLLLTELPLTSYRLPSYRLRTLKYLLDFPYIEIWKLLCPMNRKLVIIKKKRDKW